MPYQRRVNSPFFTGIPSGDILVEDFEDQQLNTPGVRMRHGLPDEDQGVDEDDGVFDGMSRNWVWSNDNITFSEAGHVWAHEINFDRDAERDYPRYVGLAMLSFSTFPVGFSDGYRLMAFDADGNALDLFVEAIHLPPSTPYFSTAGTQFIGFHSDDGISRILFSGRILDHLQYGWAVPEPDAAILTGLPAFLLLARRRRSPEQRR